MEFLKTVGKTIGITFKRLYDILAAYLLFWVLYLAGVAVGLHYGLPLVWGALEVANPELVWTEMARPLGVDVATVKLGVLVGLHLLIFLILRRPIQFLQPIFERGFDNVAGFFDRITTGRWSLRAFGEVVFTLAVTAMLVPFVWQPTLVRGMDSEAWAQRAANLVDGSAVIDLPDSVVGYYRRFTAEPVVAEEGVSSEELDAIFANVQTEEEAEIAVLDEKPPRRADGEPDGQVTDGGLAGVPRGRAGLEVELAPIRGNQPAMDRWDDHILDAVNHDSEMFAYVKAFMYVESAGRQYAVSHTGCLGLMQFCSGTAKSPPFRRVFGTGQVYACSCQRTSCAVDRPVQRALESGQMSQVDDQQDSFPCELTDARFDPPKALKAGRVYVERLHQSYGGNIYLMYIGYNSGPAVANRVWKAVGQNADATLADIDANLEQALRPYYGNGASRRARGLVKIHLPKINRAHMRYQTQLEPVPVATHPSARTQIPTETNECRVLGNACSEVPSWQTATICSRG